ncbi:MAG: hypothetical protein FWG13_00335 [Leptospirales bacterium]|nr:hypothetical protein [Leptospirales bacterium]
MKILLLTEQNAHLGAGHIQRMLSLLDYLNDCGFTAGLAGSAGESADTELFIRDMRDSSADEIKVLQKTATVVAVDDRGSGRAAADKVIDLLPHPAHDSNDTDYHPEAFLYGHEFRKSLESFNGSLNKDIPFVMYAGAEADEQAINFLLAAAPKELSGVMLANGRRVRIENGKYAGEAGRAYAEIILSANVLVSHFGITMYEAALGGASCIAVNPSEYHNALALKASGANIVHSGLREALEPFALSEIIRREALAVRKEADLGQVKKKIFSNMDNFIKLAVS